MTGRIRELNEKKNHLIPVELAAVTISSQQNQQLQNHNVRSYQQSSMMTRTPLSNSRKENSNNQRKFHHHQTVPLCQHDDQNYNTELMHDREINDVNRWYLMGTRAMTAGDPPIFGT